jgi:Lipocalin-like domain
LASKSALKPKYCQRSKSWVSGLFLTARLGKAFSPGKSTSRQSSTARIYGAYQADQGAHTFTFHIEGALVRTLIGKDLTRVYEFSGNQLIVKSANPNEHWKVAWEHY